MNVASMMRAALLVIAAAIAGVNVAAGSCAPPPGVESSRAASLAVFVGKVLAGRDSFETRTELINGEPKLIVTSPGTRVAQLQVLHAWKGVRADSVLTVVTSTRGSRFTVGDCYLIYADSISVWSRALAGWRDTALYAGQCSRTRELRIAAGDLRVLGLTARDAEWLRGPYRWSADSLALVPLADSLARARVDAETTGKKRRNGH